MAKDKTPELLLTAAVRAKFCDELGGEVGMETSSCQWRVIWKHHSFQSAPDEQRTWQRQLGYDDVAQLKLSVRSARVWGKGVAESKSTSTTTELARERNRAANDRTLMAWIRTSLSLIGFGFGAGKIGDYLASTGQPLDDYESTRIIGSAFITLGVLALFAAMIQHVRLARRLEQRDYVYRSPLPIGLGTATLLLVIGLFAFVAIFI